MVLIYGVFDFAEVGGPMFARTQRDAYLRRNAKRSLLEDPLVSPIHGAPWLPPTLLIIGGQDRLLHDSRALQQRLERTQRFLATELARSRRTDLRGLGLPIARAVRRAFG